MGCMQLSVARRLVDSERLEVEEGVLEGGGVVIDEVYISERVGTRIRVG